jgi:GH35 family endo-1,4-beta-xylanase
VLSINQSINQSINIFTEYWKSKMLHIHVSRGKFCFTTVEIMLNFVNNYKM